MSEILRLEKILYRAGGKPILEVEELGVRQGEILTVLGRTGAGKSTLLRLMNFLIRPEKGKILWRGERVQTPVRLELRRRIAMTFQDPLLFKGSVYQNVIYGLHLRGLRGKKARQRVDEVLSILAIDHLRQRPCNKLSGGEAQRVALARSVVLRPDLLLLDEPLASLDPATKESLAREIKQVVRHFQLTCVYVTHDQGEASQVADRIAIIERGRILQVGAAEEIFYCPQNEEVAYFIRTENILKGRVLSNSEGLATIALGQEAIEAVTPYPEGNNVLVCLRPEEIVLRKDTFATASESARNRFQGRITALDYRGPVVKVHLYCGFPLVALITRRSVLDLNLKEGEKIMASFKATSLHILLKEDKL